MTLRPLVLTGGPAVGKSSTARGLAALRVRAAVVEVDDVRQMIVSGGVAPWKGEEGRRQRRIGVSNACALATNFVRADIDVVVTDVLTADTALLYRELLPECFIVRLVLDFDEAQRRAAGRKLFLTAEEFAALHRADRSEPPSADRLLEVDRLTPAAQIRTVDELWAAASG